MASSFERSSAFGRARYRARQFFRNVRPHLAPDEVAEARRRLSAAEFALFLAAEPYDRRHSLDLFHLLRREGARRGATPSDELLVAALVHDVGKGRVRVWHRVLFVVLNRFAPRLCRRFESTAGPPWEQALWRLRYHARLGADLLAEVGSSPRVVEVVRRHTTAPDAVEPADPEAAWFIRCDDRV